MKIFKKIFKLSIFCLVVGGLGVIGIIAYFAKDLPNLATIGEREIVQSTKIYDRTGEIILYDIHGEEKRTVIPFDQIPQYVKNATIVIEDDNFYHHIGLDWRAILRAAWANLQGKRIAQGGSTITQQFIKNAYLGGPQSERTYARKIKEAILALMLERKHTKDEILESYLNQVPYGSNAYGIEAASQTFFNKSAQELTLAEAALLAALPQAPSYYSPYGSHPSDLENRQEYILDKMVDFAYVTREEADQAKEEELKYALQSGLKAHHFVSMVREYLEEQYGHVYADINMAGLKVYTTLDWDYQQMAEQIVDEGAASNEERYNAGNAALVAIDPRTGEVITLVGSRSYDEDQFNVATSPYRQPGSSFKPFAYAVAFEKGLTPDSVIFDTQTNFGWHGGEEYIPQNYDRKFRGPLTLRQALAQSINITAVKVLYLAGINDTINLAQDMGITTLKDRQRYSLSLVLGGGEVKLIDETAAYGVFATEGIKHSMHFITRIEDAEGNVLEERRDKPVKVMDAEIARQVNNVLSDNAARAPMFGAYSKLYLPERPAAAKTGTTQDYSDGWTVGYTPSLVVGVWAGNNKFTDKMWSGAAGAAVAAPMWNEFIRGAYDLSADLRDQDELPDNKFILPQHVEYFTSPQPIASSSKPMVNGEVGYNREVAIDSISGKLATDLTPPELIETRIYPEIHSILHFVDKDDITGPMPDESNRDASFSLWEEPVLQWASEQPCGPGYICYNQALPTEYDDVHIPANQPSANITFPQQNDLITQAALTIKALASAPLGVKQVDFFFNDQLVGTDTRAPYSINFNLSPYLLPTNRQTIKIRVYDAVLNRKEDSISVRTNF